MLTARRPGWRIFAALACLVAAAPAARADQKVRFVLDYRADAERGGYYQALASGIYRKHGLDVTIIQAGAGIDGGRMLATGAVEFIQTSNDFGPFNLIKAGAHVRAVAAIFQRNPQVLIVHPESGITSLAEMKGRPIMLANAGVGGFWDWLKAKYGFSDTQVRHTSFSLQPWIVDPAAIVQGYITNEPVNLRLLNIPARAFQLADDGFPGYAAMIMTTDATIASDPHLVQEFVDASIEGWQDFLWGDPAPGLAMIKSLNSAATDELNAGVMDAIRKVHLVDGGEARTAGIGAMTDESWRTFFEEMSRVGLYPPDFPWQQAYTLQFTNRAHRLPPSE